MTPSKLFSILRARWSMVMLVVLLTTLTAFGVSLLLPVFQSFPLVLEAGPHLRNFHQPGVFASAFFGLRSFNHYGHYDMAAGISVIGVWIR